MPTLRPAYGHYQHHSLKRKLTLRGFARLFSRRVREGISTPQLWTLKAPEFYRTARMAMLVLFIALMSYATNLALQSPNSAWSREWLWPAAEFVGLTIKTIEIQGHRQDSEIALKAAAQVETGAPIFAMDVQGIQARIAALPGVKFASVQTLLPNTVRIQVEEREPFALWQRRGQWAVVDEDGEIITDKPDSRYVGLPMVVGQGAEKAAPALFAELERFPELRKRMNAAIFVAERRWNLHLEEGVDIKLPAVGLREALDALAKLEREQKVLEKDITVIDLRFQDKVIMRLTDSAAEKRQETLKNRYGKKAGRPA